MTAQHAQAHVAHVDGLLANHPGNIIHYAIDNTRKVTAPLPPALASDTHLLKTVVRLERNDTFAAAHKLYANNPNDRAAALNMANQNVAGGGFLSGGRAQEEDLCHCSNLYQALRNAPYPLQPNELLYSPRVQVMKRKTPSGYQVLDPSHWFWVDVISCAAIQQPATRQLLAADGVNINTIYRHNADRQLMRNKTTWIINEAVQNGVNRLVLSPLGCGVFRNPVLEVANIMKDILIGRADGSGPQADWARHGLMEIVIAIFDPSGHIWNEFMNVFKEGNGLHDGDGDGMPVPELVQYTTFPPQYVAQNTE